ncbi:prepilin-type N-terminal cleavage/methylation domain-containing protein [Rhodoferax sp. AJA081-3]|uniref:prepilin-type N-terminal cleavage/methylation domain-containing protein n=1 Tax=Rhodoferax sp. AJA081-3 TaxID=2752316 RepID=UPI001ADF78E7|nr:prepilin-type N-terminal cleavage/methylation domain-containing protein [Rhodoferax sp. AJA081-3]QTN26491.1 prepilin-type N-terminal cleavage/methylation domain-containing protein [Rhodoferax sp. AJA081-3]
MSQTTPTFRPKQKGFTLVELVMVIVILGAIGGTVAVFMKAPIDAYFDSARRAALTDVADTTVRRISRDLHRSLPNSIRNPDNGSLQCLEFIPTKTGGRYRAEESAPGNNLDFSIEDTTFNMLGSNTTFAGLPIPADQQIAAGDRIAVYNLGIAGASAYEVGRTGVVNGVVSGAETAITLTTGIRFPLASPSKRFHVINATEQVVGYVCTGDGTLRRYTMTLPNATPASCPLAAAVVASPVLARNVASCSFDYIGPDLLRNALVRMTLELTDSGETVTLQHEVHVNNTP